MYVCVCLLFLLSFSLSFFFTFILSSVIIDSPLKTFFLLLLINTGLYVRVCALSSHNTVIDGLCLRHTVWIREVGVGYIWGDGALYLQ